MWKKLFCAALIAALSLGLGGCGGSSSNPEADAQKATKSPQELRRERREGDSQQAPAPGAQEAPAAAEQK